MSHERIGNSLNSIYRGYLKHFYPNSRTFSEGSLSHALINQEPWADVTEFPPHITPTSIHGVCLIHRQQFCDDRGSFQMVWQLSDVTRILGKEYTFRQQNHSRTLPKDRPILRGIHAEPQAKIIRVLSGNAHIVLVDLRPWSTTFLRTEQIILERTYASKPAVALVLPPGIGNSFMAYKNPEDCGDGALDYLYTVSEEYDPKTTGMGVRFDDIDLRIPWPHENPQISQRDRDLPTLQQFLERCSNNYGY